MALRTRNDFYHAHTNVNTRRLVPTSRLVANVTGIKVQRNKAIVGQNAFAHEAGIHQDGMLKEPSTYEIMRPEDVGLTKSDLVLGKHSGRAALADRAKALGYHLSREQLEKLFLQFKQLADKKKNIYDGDLAALVEQQFQAVSELFTLDSYDMICGTGHTPRVSLRLRRGSDFLETTMSCGDGPVDAIFLAIEELTGFTVQCRDFQVHSVTVGKDAQGEVMVVVEHEGQIYRGRGMSTDSVEASAKAFLNAVNRIAAVARAAEGQGNAGAAEDVAAKP
jgi:2-isopropylmalate synthase